MTAAMVSAMACMAGAAEVSPTDLVFVRQAARRWIFDQGTGIPLAGIYPDRVVAPDVMHPVMRTAGEGSVACFVDGNLVFSGTAGGEISRWLGSLNPFAAYEVDIAAATGDSGVGIEFAGPEEAERMTILAEFTGGQLAAVRRTVHRDGACVVDERQDVPAAITPPFRLHIQMLGAGLNVLAEKDGQQPRLVGQADFNEDIELRAKTFSQRGNTRLTSSSRAPWG